MADYAIHEETLQDIAGIIRKKDGTQAGIDPADYADRINLMGMLEEKTVSGTIAHITDGADEVPIKAWEVEIAPTLTGKSAVECTQTGKNLVDFNGHTEATYSGLTITENTDGSISFSGTPSRTWAHLTTDFAVDLPIGTYTLSRNASASYAMYIAVKYEDNTTENISMATSASKTFTTTKKIIQIRLDIATLSTSTNYDETVSVMLEVGSTPSTFEKYVAPTISTVNLGRTIYGGTADVVNGQGSGECGKIVFDGSNDEIWANYSSGNGYAIANSDMLAGTHYNNPLAICDEFNKVPDNTNLGIRIGVNNQNIYIVQANTITGVSDLSTWREWLAENPVTVIYPLATTEDFTFTPITPTPETALGTNNFWADSGDSEVTYRGQGTVYQYPEGEGVSF